jgi:hypothetical protein
MLEEIIPGSIIHMETSLLKWRLRRNQDDASTIPSPLTTSDSIAAQVMSPARSPILTGILHLKARIALMRFEVAFADRVCNTLLYDDVCDILKEHLPALLPKAQWESPLFGANIDHLCVLHRVRSFAKECRSDGYTSLHLKQVTLWLERHSDIIIPTAICEVAFVKARRPLPQVEPKDLGLPISNTPTSVFEFDEAESDDK